MRILLWLFLLIFWGGVALLVLSNLHVIAVAPWIVLIVWLVIIGLYITGFVIYYKITEK